MALCIWPSIFLLFFWATLFLRIHQYECKQFDLTLWPVDSCPGNQSAVELASHRLNCSGVTDFINVYHCLPLSNLSLLAEFCYDGLSGLIEKGNCMVLENQHLNNHPCTQFTNGCPAVPYYSKNMFNFPACIQINKQSRCYLADPSCPPIISFVEAATTQTTSRGNSIVPTTEHVIVAVVLPAVLCGFALCMVVWTCTRHQKKSNNDIESEENKPLKKKEDNLTNNSVNSAIYNCEGAKIRWNNLIVRLKDEIPESTITRLKDSLKEIVPVQKLNKESLEMVKSVRDLVNFMISEKLFTERDVILMQHFMRMIKRPELVQKCVDYATNQKDMLCYFVEEKDTVRCTQVELHVDANIEDYTKLDSLIKTVAAIIDCDPQSVKVVEIRPKNSFIIVIEVERKLAQILSRNLPRERMKLAEFKIDAIEIDRNFIKIAEPDVSLSHYLSPAVVIPSYITVPEVDSVSHISCVTSDRLWVSDYGRLLQIDSSGHQLEQNKFEIVSLFIGGFHTVTKDGELLFIGRDFRVQNVTSEGTVTIDIKVEYGRLICIYSSRINGDILVGYLRGVMRYDRTGQWIRDFIKDSRCDIRYPIYITENNNGDIWVSDLIKNAVIVVDKSGRHRFNYEGQQSQSDFDPRGICIDILGQALVCDCHNSSVHLLDQDGQFLCLLLTREHGLRSPMALCVDDKHNLYLGQLNSNTITVYKYLAKTKSKDTSLKNT